MLSGKHLPLHASPTEPKNPYTSRIQKFSNLKKKPLDQTRGMNLTGREETPQMLLIVRPSERQQRQEMQAMGGKEELGSKENLF
jgi:hypothetical protein